MNEFVVQLVYGELAYMVNRHMAILLAIWQNDYGELAHLANRLWQTGSYGELAIWRTGIWRTSTWRNVVFPFGQNPFQTKILHANKNLSFPLQKKAFINVGMN